MQWGMMKALLIDEDPNHATHLERSINRRGVVTSWTNSVREAIGRLRGREASFDLVVLSIGERSQRWIEILHKLQQAAWQPGVSEFPIFLCVSRLSLGVEFQLQVERMGARLVHE